MTKRTESSRSAILSSDRTLPMKVFNMGFLLDRLGTDCAPLQFIRELTVNSIQAIQSSSEASAEKGTVVWDYDPTFYSEERVFKLSIIDNGAGMTGPEMVAYINQLSSSGRAQSLSENYGLGAKIAAATRNHAGVIYMSWKDGEGAMIHLWRNPADGVYGLKQFQWDNAEFHHWMPITDELKPTQIAEHGTIVVLVGKKDEEHTMEPPPGAASPSRWVARYLNSRFFEFPPGITIRAREGWTSDSPDTNVLRLVRGSREFLDKYRERSGTVDVGTATAHWWILKSDDAVSQSSGANLGGGHVAALYQNELYDFASARSGVARLQSFGVTLGHSRVVLYLEPKKDVSVTTNTARTSLIFDGEAPPWGEWAEAFRDNLPNAIKELIESVLREREATDYSKSINERLKEISDLYRLKKYRPSKVGNLTISDEMLTGNPRGSNEPSGRGRGNGGGRLGIAGRKAGDLFTRFLKEGGTSGTLAKDKFDDLKVLWVPEAEVGYPDRAAAYQRDTNTLLINQDFRVFTQFVDYLEKKLCTERKVRQIPGAREVINEEMRQWFEQQLREVIYSVEAFRGEKEWDSDQLDQLVSPESLTAAVLPRYHVEIMVKRAVGSKLGGIKPRERLA